MANNKMLHTKAEVVKQNVQKDEGVIDAVVGSTNVLDRMGDVISQDGWDLKSYKSNPVVLWGHNVKEERPPIGKALKVWIENKGEKASKLMFKVKFDLQDSFAAEVFRKVKEGFINTVSVGFLPVEWEELSKENGPFGGRKYTSQELLELSFVPVPANPQAVIALRSMKDKRFEPAELEELYPVKEEKVKKDEEVEEVKDEVEETKVEEPKEEVVETQPEEVVEEKLEEKKEVEEEKVEEEVQEEETKEEEKEEEPKEEAEEEKVEEAVEEVPEEEVEEEKTSVKEDKVVSKSVIGFKDLGTLPESEPWDGPGEKAKADVSDLKLMCAWYDSEKPDVKSSYKLPHHKAEGHKAVWRGVAAAMAALLGARGGVDIPSSDRRGIFNHLKKHYAQFDKEAPDFKMVEEQVLAGLSEEIQALVLNRQDKHMTRLVKKVIKGQKETKNTSEYTSKQIEQALRLLNLTLSLYNKSSKKGVK